MGEHWLPLFWMQWDPKALSLSVKGVNLVSIFIVEALLREISLIARNRDRQMATNLPCGNAEVEMVMR